MDTPLLSTKLFIPPLCPNLVRRPRLVGRLNEGLASAKCALISAPAGYGKTALLSEWLDQGNIRAAWLSLDQGDDDVQRFLTYAIAALQIVDRGIGAGWAAVLGTSQRPSIDDMLALLLNDLAAIDDPLVLILDDYHVITAQAVHKAVCFLLDHIPPQVLLVIATRADPPFSLARLRASGRLVELRAADLRFTRPEIAALLDLVAPASLDQDGIATLEMRSEGWIAGLHMMALSMRDTKDIAGFVAALSGTQRHIADYLTDQVLDRQPPPVRDFLLKTSILDRLSGPLCDAVTGRSDSQAMLERLARDNLFLIPLDHKRTWYRYHHLFADLLRVRLDQRRPGRAGDLYRRASEWFAGAGDVDAALSCAHAAGDVARILDILDRHAETLWNRGQYATLLKWLDELGDDLLRARPWLRVHHALALVMSGQFSAGAARLQALEWALQLEPTGEEASLLRGMIAAGRAYLAYYQRDVPGMMAHAQQALERLPASSAFWRGGLAVVLGSAHEHNGDTVAATEAFLAARAAGQAAGSGFLSLTASVHLAINHAYQGQLRRAVQVCRQQLLSGGLSRIPAAGTLHAVWGDVLREWNRLEEAREHVERGNALCVQGRSVAARAWSHLSSLKLCFSEGDLDAATRALEALESLTEAPAWVHAEITAWQARLWLAQDRIEMAARLIETRGLAPDDGLVFLYLNEYVALARLLVAQGRRDAGSPALDRAVQLLGRLRRATRAGGWTALHLQVLVLLAGARRAQGATEQGLDLLNQGLLLAEPEGFARVFLDEGEWVAQMLGLAAARRDLSPYAATLLSAIHTASDGGAQPLVEPLTERELEVLRLIADGLSNREIGDRLFITTGTVKVHASNIYGKLGVNGRVQAVAWAQELNLI